MERRRKEERERRLIDYSDTELLGTYKIEELLDRRARNMSPEVRI